MGTGRVSLAASHSQPAPQSRISAIMRDALSKMIKGIQADTILEEHIEVQSAFYPLYEGKGITHDP